MDPANWVMRSAMRVCTLSWRIWACSCRAGCSLGATIGRLLTGFPPSSLNTWNEGYARRGPSRGRLVEGVPAGAGALRGRVVDREAGLIQRVHEVDRCLREVGHAHLVHHEANAELLGGLVLLGDLVIEVHGVA